MNWNLVLLRNSPMKSAALTRHNQPQHPEHKGHIITEIKLLPVGEHLGWEFSKKRAPGRPASLSWVPGETL